MRDLLQLAENTLVSLPAGDREWIFSRTAQIALSGARRIDRMVNTEPVALHSLLGNHPNTKALKSGAVSSPLVQFDYFEVKVANTQFKAMVRELQI